MPGADSMWDRAIPTFGGGEPRHFAGIKTFLKAPYFENVREFGRCDSDIDDGCA